MSFPKQVLREAEELSVSFLSAQTVSALKNALQKQALSGSERHTLDDAATFLEQIAAGAEIASASTVRAGSSPSRSIAAFDMALGPIGALKSLVREDQGLDLFFGGLANAVRTLGETGAVGANAGEEQIQTARTFFEGLRGWLAAELSASRPKIGDRSFRLSHIG